MDSPAEPIQQPGVDPLESMMDAIRDGTYYALLGHPPLTRTATVTEVDAARGVVTVSSNPPSVDFSAMEPRVLTSLQDEIDTVHRMISDLTPVQITSTSDSSAEAAYLSQQEVSFARTQTSRWRGSQPQTLPRGQEILIFQGIRVDPQEGYDDQVYLQGRTPSGRPETVVHILNNDHSRTPALLERAIIDFRRDMGSRPTLILMTPRRLEYLRRVVGAAERPPLPPWGEYPWRIFQDAVVSTPQPLPPLTGHELRRREAMNTDGHKIHLTTRDGYRKTIRMTGTIGDTISIPEPVVGASASGGTNNPQINRRDFKITRRAHYVDCSTRAQTEEYWAVENG